ncbi:arylamine N-acetyltransferase 2 [Karstenula rhodostoma CBS 690.94]|uniref:Arylamine N-acetyltransferase 2 n=1 Tax=Karstenula rhodostoma CBS 690.94 TaxID=1392251 RepID=A0A9P4PB95_9PLEO|nr:arylamine N-acetyltransferase 2 [Karstenula rhodostoma CBS 690.94]
MASSLSPEQLSAYVHHIGLPAKYHPANKPIHDLAFLTQLHVHTISTIPYDNLTLHYSSSKKISIYPQDAFKKIITDNRGRGGYCMENSILFNHVLRGLGFTAYMAGVRIRLRENGIPAGAYIGWVHLVNIVTLPSGDKYMLDVGFGGDAPTTPIPLVHGHTTTNISPQENRLVYGHIPQQVVQTEETKLWIYQYRNGEEVEWNSFYAFPLLEFLEADFKIMNWYAGSHPESFQTFTMLIIKFLRRQKEGGEEGEMEVYGKRMLVNGVVKENTGGKTRVVQECSTEAERYEALEKWFGMRLSEEEKTGIVGHATELRG